MRQRSPWQRQPSQAVAINPQWLTQLLLLVRGFYRQHQCPRILPQTSTGSSVYPAGGGKQTWWDQLRGAERREIQSVRGPVSCSVSSSEGITAVSVLSLLGRRDLQGAWCGRMLESAAREPRMFFSVCLLPDDSEIIQNKKPLWFP